MSNIWYHCVRSTTNRKYFSNVYLLIYISRRTQRWREWKVIDILESMFCIQFPITDLQRLTIRLTFVTSHSFYLIIEKYLLDSFSHDGFPARHLPFRRNTDAIGKIKSFFLDYFILILSSLERFVNIDNVTNGQKKKK